VTIALNCIEVARAGVGEPLKHVGEEFFFVCPNHKDHDPSLKVNRKKNVWICGPCAASGNAWELAAFIAKLNPKNKQGMTLWLKNHELSTAHGTDNSTITVDDLARHKKLPKAFLLSLGLKNVPNGVQIPYRLTDGTDAPRQRIRTACIAKNGSYWTGPKEKEIVPYGLDRLPEGRSPGVLSLVEGESDQWTLTYHEVPGLGIPGAAMAHVLKADHVTGISLVYIFQEPGNSGLQFVMGVSKRLHEIGWKGQIRIVTLDGFKDVNEMHQADSVAFKQKLQMALDVASTPEALTPVGSTEVARISPWSRAIGMDVFLEGEDEPLVFMYPRVIVKGTVVEVYSPRGLGKSIWANHVAVLVAKAGLRVLLIDRDNPRRIVKKRLRKCGASEDLKNLKIISRENAPPLTDTVAWREFPYTEYDLVVIDSLDSAAEGVGEQDSARPSKAIAPLLDIAHRENGPAVLILGNCVRTGAHSRGSGVIEDRADVVFEVRDATDFRPSGTKPWVEELPPADAGNWQSRSTRRKQREKYSLAFVSTKFRIADEPDPFILEIVLSTDPWTIHDVTDDVNRQGNEQRQDSVNAKTEAAARIKDAFVAELTRRREANEKPMLKEKDAIPFLMSLGFPRSAARDFLDNPSGLWTVRKIEKAKGNPIGVFLPEQPEKTDGGGNVGPPEVAVSEGSGDADLRQAPPERAAELPVPQLTESTAVTERLFSAAVTIPSHGLGQENKSAKQGSNSDSDGEADISGIEEEW
jgi:hypothetical protein